MIYWVKKTESTFPKDVSYVNDHSTDPKEIVNILIRYFVDIGPKLSQSISNQSSSFSNSLKCSNDNSLFFEPIDPSEILTIVRNLKK